VSDASWIALSGAASGRGSATVTYAVARYTGMPKSRTGTLTIAGKSFVVTQTKVAMAIRNPPPSGGAR
jgi:hypothetical protein